MLEHLLTNTKATAKATSTIKRNIMYDVPHWTLQPKNSQLPFYTQKLIEVVIIRRFRLSVTNWQKIVTFNVHNNGAALNFVKINRRRKKCYIDNGTRINIHVFIYPKKNCKHFCNSIFVICISRYNNIIMKIGIYNGCKCYKM